MLIKAGEFKKYLVMHDADKIPVGVVNTEVPACKELNQKHGGNLEQKFRDAVAKHNPEIQERLRKASKLLAEAEQIAEEHGIPFSPEPIICDGMVLGFVPQSFDSIYGELRNENPDLISKLTGVYISEYSGWQKFI